MNLRRLSDAEHVSSMRACPKHAGAAMSVMIQIRNVPEHVHRVLKARSALSGKSLSDLIINELNAMAALPSAEELQQRLRQAEGFAMSASSAESIRRERDAS
jgi:plasmid stability protein